MSEELIKRLHLAANGASFDGRAGDAFLMREAAHALSRPAPVQVPSGWRLVPVEPTQRMLDSVHGMSLGEYAHMLAAAPSAPAASESGAREECRLCGGDGKAAYGNPCIRCGGTGLADEREPAAPAVDAEKVIALVEEYGDLMCGVGMNSGQPWARKHTAECRKEADTLLAQIRALLTPSIANQESQDV